jgi:hypothetical protein
MASKHRHRSDQHSPRRSEDSALGEDIHDLPAGTAGGGDIHGGTTTAATVPGSPDITPGGGTTRGDRGPALHGTTSLPTTQAGADALAAGGHAAIPPHHSAGGDTAPHRRDLTGGAIRAHTGHPGLRNERAKRGTRDIIPDPDHLISPDPNVRDRPGGTPHH